MARKSYTQDPADSLDYSIDWVDWLDEGETVYSSTWAVSPAGLNTALPSIVNNGTCTVVWLSGGTADRSYTVTNHITTTAGRTVERSITLVIRNL
jgi:hypothetical protein